MSHFAYLVGNRNVTVAEILELWQSVDESITELLSIQIAATFAFLIAMFVVGQRLDRVIFALLCLGALITSYFMRKGTAALDS
jgi:hypothetical protein